MGLVDLFRAKHKHSNPEVRAEAVEEMGPDELDKLTEVARGDSDARVRAIAVEKLDDSGLLAELASADQSTQVRALAAGRAARLLATEAITGSERGSAEELVDKVAALPGGGTTGAVQDALGDVACKAKLDSVRRAALEYVSEPRTLADVVRASDDEELTRLALERIVDIDVLRSIAISEKRKVVGVAAVDLIEDDDALEQVASKGKNKAVRARARKRISDRKPVKQTPGKEARDHAERVQMTKLAENLARKGDYAQKAELDEAVARWDEIGTGDDTKLEKRFNKAVAKFETAHARYAERKQAEADKKADREEREAARAARAARAEKNRDEPISDIEAKSADVADDEAGADADADADADATADKAPAKKPSRAEAAAEGKRVLGAVVEELEGLLESDRLKDIDQGLRGAEKKFSKIRAKLGEGADELVGRYDDAKAKLKIRIGSLRDELEWKNWAHSSKQKELVDRAQALLEGELTEDLGDKLKALQAEWKATGGGPRKKGQDLWETFKEKCDAVYERVKELRAEDNALRKENLGKKIALCEQAEELSDSEDWGPTAEALKRLQAEWKEIGPVPRRKSKSIYDRFRAACDKFFERRKPLLDEAHAERAENLEAKVALLARVETLATDESIDIEDALDQFTEIAGDMREIGHIPRAELDGFNKRYAAAKEKLFARRDGAAQASQREKQERIDALRARMRELSAEATPSRAKSPSGGVSSSMSPVDTSLDTGWDLEPAAPEPEPAAAEAPDDLAERAVGLRKDIFALAEEPAFENIARELSADLDKVLVTLLDKHGAAFKGTELDPESCAERRRRLIAKVEELYATDDDEPEAETPEQMAERLREALADNALGGVLSKKASPELVAQVTAEAEGAWRRLPPVPGATGAELERQFAAAVQRARS